MAIVTSTVTGRVLLPNDTAYTDGVLSFQLSETDVESEAVMPTGKLSVTLDGDDIPAGFTLWRNTRGLRGTTYAVTLAATVTTEVGGGRTFTQRKNFSLGNCQVGSESTYTIGALLGNPVGDPADWARQVRYFDTRANFVSWAGANDPYVGQVIFTEGISYRFIDSGTAIGDLPGWVIQEAGTTSIADDAVTNAKLAEMAQATFKMRASGAGTGNPIDGTATQAKTALAIAGSDVSMSGGGTAAEYTGFSTRAAFVSWASGKTPAVGTVIRAEGYAYRYIGSGTAISDLAGWVPDGEINLAHWGVDLTGATDDYTKINACFSYGSGKTIVLPDGIINWTALTTGAHTMGANTVVRGAGIGKTILRVAVSSTTFVRAFNISAANIRIQDFTFQFPTSASAKCAFANFSSSSFRALRVRWEGGVVYTAGVASHSATIFNLNQVDCDDIELQDCEWDSVVRPWLKTNASTVAHNNLRFLNCQSYNSGIEANGQNSPLGVNRSIQIVGGSIENPDMNHALSAGISFASGEDIVIANMNIQGAFLEAMHFEEAVHRMAISNVNVYLTEGDGLALLSNDNGGSWGRPEQVTVTNCNFESETVVSGTTGVRLTFDGNDISPADFVVFNGLTVKGFEDGIRLGTRADDDIRFSNTIVSDCSFGLVMPDSSFIDCEGITLKNCGTGVHSYKGGWVDNVTFHNCDETHLVDDGVLEFKDPKWNYGSQVLSAGVTKYFRMLKRVTGSQANTSLRVYFDGSHNHTVMYTTNWDGTTETVTSIRSMSSGGSITAIVAMFDEAATVTVSAGGTGYTVGDVLSVSGGTLEPGGSRTTATVASVSGGVVTGVTLTNPGEWATPPSNPASTTGGTGSGCTLTLTTTKTLGFRVYDSTGHTVSIQAKVTGSVFVV